MSKSTTLSTLVATATQCPCEEREDFIPSMVANDVCTIISFENAIYTVMEKLSQGQYSGGHWNFYTFPNGAKAMVFEDECIVEAFCETNGRQCNLSMTALSLAVNLYVLSHLSFSLVSTKSNVCLVVSDFFHRLRDALYDIAESDSDLAEEVRQIFYLLD
ncbi:antirestriction protein [Thalassotalea marina]|uniref:Antirestriction protein n=1 Tax=Thalassotalea marina TaxID=1673741 RepID=A0A919EPP4_9GAMM|nr:antirestriction protein [Thalassotalea marina]GHG07256.1 hypothetical protein GCM10017161_41240 [Thalassotalea marina]